MQHGNCLKANALANILKPWMSMCAIFIGS